MLKMFSKISIWSTLKLNDQKSTSSNTDHDHHDQKKKNKLKRPPPPPPPPPPPSSVMNTSCSSNKLLLAVGLRMLTASSAHHNTLIAHPPVNVVLKFMNSRPPVSHMTMMITSTATTTASNHVLNSDSAHDMTKAMTSSLQYPSNPYSYLSSCFLCNNTLRLDKDVYMYRGDQGFCSVECRSRQMYLDEMRELEDSTKRTLASFRRPCGQDSRLWCDGCCETRSLLLPQSRRRRDSQPSTTTTTTVRVPPIFTLTLLSPILRRKVLNSSPHCNH